MDSNLYRHFRFKCQIGLIFTPCFLSVSLLFPIILNISLSFLLSSLLVTKCDFYLWDLIQQLRYFSLGFGYYQVSLIFWKRWAQRKACIIRAIPDINRTKPLLLQKLYTLFLGFVFTSIACFSDFCIISTLTHPVTTLLLQYCILEVLERKYVGQLKSIIVRKTFCARCWPGNRDLAAPSQVVHVPGPIVV